MIIAFNSSSTSIVAGQSVTISWETANATAVRLNGLPVALTGSKNFTPNSNQTYGLAVDGAATTITGSLTVSVTQPAPAPSPSPGPSPSPSPGPSPSPTPSPSQVAIAAVPIGEARIISGNLMVDVWEGPQPAGGGTIDKGVHAWSSGIYAPLLGSLGSLINFSGGDADSWDTAVRAFDLSTLLWARIKNRTTALSWDPATDYARLAGDPLRYDTQFSEHGDGTPGVPHTYDFLEYLPPEAGGGTSGSLLKPATRFAYPQNSSNQAHRLPLAQPAAWTRSGVPGLNLNLLGMSVYDPTTKRVWMIDSTASGAFVDTLKYLDFSDGSGVGTPGAVSLAASKLVYSGCMRFWRGLDGTKRYLVWLCYGLDARINIVDLDAPTGGIHPITLDNTPVNLGFPYSGFCIGSNRAFALHPDPANDASTIYDIVPPSDAINGTWGIVARPLNGIGLVAEGNQGLWKRLTFHENLGVVTFYIGSATPVYAYRPPPIGSPVPPSTITPPPTPAPSPAPGPSPSPVPSPSPAPTPSTGTLKLVSTTLVPWTGVGAVLGLSKHLDFARIGNRWYKAAGDHVKIDSNTPDEQGGRQEIISFNVLANDWREDKLYFLRSGLAEGTVEIANPDDGGIAARANTEIWSFVSERVLQTTTAQQTANMQALYGSDIVTQDMQDVGAWNPATGIWRVGGARPQEMKGDNTWRWLWDSVPDHFIGPTPASFVTFDKDGNDISLRSGGVLHDYGSVDFHSSGIVQDGRNAYVYDQTHGALYRFSLDGGQPFTLVNVLSLPDITWTVAGRGITIVWHPVLRAVIILGYGSDFKGRMYAFEVDTNKLTGWPRADGFVNGAGNWVSPATSFYDPDTTDIISVGTMDWDTGIPSKGFWRVKITT